MKILAVIPARAGSKGIPNKNIRIIGEHPLIYYSINNAKNSKYITDIVVTTDSEEVKLIARKMNVNYKDRNVELCADNITLDSVIYDAIPKDQEWDYIVTMQPTSPTLTVETLDSAIKFAIDNDLDTLISAINKPHLSWSEVDGKKVPNYKERLNRQYLPPYYVETGAFVVSKYSVVTSSTRIGKNVDIYEIPESESQDIDDFSDLLSVELSLKKQKVAFFVNGNNEIGLGHVYRVLELADEFYSKPDIYYDSTKTDSSVFGNTTYNIIPVKNEIELYEKCRNNNYTIFINDILSTTANYMDGLRSCLGRDAKIINFEDDGEGSIQADLVFNALYASSAQPNVHCGELYYVCPKTFLFFNPISIKDKVENVLITFGGADPQNYTDRILNMIIKQEYDNYNFTIVLGRAKSNVDDLMKYNEYKNIEVLYNIKNMPELISKNDIAITSRGRTGYEVALMGIPTIAMSQNEREERHSFVCDQNGFTYIGLNPTDEIIEKTLQEYLALSKDSRQELQNKMLQHDLKKGRNRIVSLIDSL